MGPMPSFNHSRYELRACYQTPIGLQTHNDDHSTRAIIFSAGQDVALRSERMIEMRMMITLVFPSL